MSDNKSDYSVVRTNLYSRVPAIMQNPLLQSMVEVTYNRFYTKPELQRIIGTVGERKTSGLSDQITEASVYDQAFQLQPIIKNTATTVTDITTYKDILRLAEQLGVDGDRVQQWQNAPQFNFVPPIDLDKLNNFNEYYWIGTDTVQYITISSYYNLQQAQLSQLVSVWIATGTDEAKQNMINKAQEVADVVPAAYRLPIKDLPEAYNFPSDPDLVAEGSDWELNNKWLHRSDVADISMAQQAKLPIIEYSRNISLNEWTYSKVRWMYRASSAYPFVAVDQGPTDDEITKRFTIVGIDSTNDAFIIDGPNSAAIGSSIIIEGSSKYDQQWTVVSAVDNTDNTATIFVAENVIPGAPGGQVVPFTTTSRGDPWKGFFEQWMVESIDSPVPVTKPNDISSNAGDHWSYTATAGQTTFSTGVGVPAENIVRVYVNDRRQYGTYEQTSTTQIVFFEGLNAGDVVEVYPMPMTVRDQKRLSVTVRVSADDSVPHQTLCLVEYRYQQQPKSTDNQYPLFDIVNYDGTPAYEANSIFTYATDGSYPVVTAIGQRIVQDTTNRDYTFEIPLVNDDGTLKYYHQSYYGTTSIWRINEDVEYKPVKVDADRKESTAADAVYEIPAQLVGNVHHEVRNTLKYSELFTHFKSIVDNQPDVDASYGDVVNKYRLLDDVNYGLGGTIKEYGYSFDQFLSTFIATEYPLTSILTFAESQYEDLLVKVREYIEANIASLAVATTSEALQDFGSYVQAQVLDYLKNDTSLSRYYGDTSVTTQSEVPNWIATLPYLRLAKRAVPELIQDAKLGINEMVHHDGHSQLSELNDATSIAAKRAMIRSLGLYPNGVQQPKPTNPSVQTLWYEASTDTVYRFNIQSFATSAPIGSFAIGNYWYNPSQNVVYQWGGSEWVTAGIDIVTLLVPFRTQELIVQCILNIENLLYNGANDKDLWYDIDALQVMYPVEFEASMKKLFETYCKSNNIANPYVGNFSQTDAFTWDYSDYNLGGAQYASINQSKYGTAYPHLQPWKLQGFAVKPDWWDITYASTTRRWSTLMWNNIKAGIIPTGMANTAGIVSTGVAGFVTSYDKVSVNTTDHTTADGYGPDDLLPPYWVPATSADNLPGIANEALLTAITSIASVARNQYAFGTNGPNEAAWKKSIDYNYARLKTAFLLDPVRFVHYTFGEEYHTVGGLEVSARLNKILSHKDVVFHGDSDTNGVPQFFDGINQLYVLFFRYNALDLNGGEFRLAWDTWTTQLGYALGGFVVDSAMSVDSNLFEITPSDYDIYMKVAKQVQDLWVDGLYVSVAQSGSYRELPLGAARDWTFNIATRCPVIRTYEYYGVKKYRIVGDAHTNSFTFVEGSLSEAGWTTGSSIVLSSGINGIIPSNLSEESYYFITKISDTQFKLADSAAKAAAQATISIGSDSDGVIYVAELSTTFYAFEGRNTPTLWKHFALNKDVVKTFDGNVDIVGLQNVVDVVDGYVARMTDQGIVFNDISVQEYDETMNRLLNWQYEIEKLIDLLYQKVTDPTLVANSKDYQVGTVLLNPFRNNLWINTPTGVVSEFNAINVKDAGSQAIIYDLDGNRITNRGTVVMRQDKQTHLAAVTDLFVVTQLADYTPIDAGPNSMGGAHIYMDEYEQVLLFNPYTIADGLIYDPFLGIQVARVHLYYEKQVEDTKRPNVGGFVYKDGKLMQNFEYTVGNIPKYYDTFTANENADFVDYARGLLGYEPRVTYLQDIGVTPKSQFLFYKGMIKAKGAIGSVQAYTSGKHFEASALDEFWAYRSFDFGDRRRKTSYSISLIPDDTLYSQIKFEFNETASTVSKYFTQVSKVDATRWIDFPSQAAKLDDADGFFTMVEDSIAAVSAQTVTVPSATGMETFNAIFHAAADDVKLIQTTTAQKVTINNTTNPVLTGLTLVPGANSIDVYINGVAQVAGTNFNETSTSSITITYVARNGTVNPTLLASDVIVVIPKTATLIEGYHYVRINSRAIRLYVTNLSNLQLVRYVANYSQFTPAMIYDSQSGATVANVPVWDPAANRNEPLLDLYTDVSSFDDIAIYNSAPPGANNDPIKFWNAPEVGRVWKDTSSYDFLPYNDVAKEANDRLVDWGKTSDWSDPTVWKWIESDLTPADYVVQGGDGTPHFEVYQRTRVVYAATLVGQTWTVPGHTLVVGNEIVITSDGELPNPLVAGTVYSVTAISGNNITVGDRAGGAITFFDAGSGNLTMSLASYGATWSRVRPQLIHMEALQINYTTQKLQTTLPFGEYTMYINGMFAQDGAVNDDGTIDIEDDVIATIGTTPAKSQLSILLKAVPAQNLGEDRPDDLDTTNSSIQSYADYPYSVVTKIGADGVSITPAYYFWVRGNSEALDDEGLVTTASLEALIDNNDDYYMYVMKPATVNGQRYLTQLVVGNVGGVVSTTNRYVLRIINDMTLRYRITQVGGGPILKPVYSEWIMFREKQNDHINRELWDKVTEAMVGYKLADATQPVPSLDRVVYDTVNGTYTRYGMAPGQAFVDGTVALSTVMSLLNSPDIVYDPIDMDYFLSIHDTSSNAGIVTMMDDMYRTFPSEHVNSIFFAVMHDALSNVNVDYSAYLMKTSAISISGTAPLNVNGAFDE